MASVEKVLIVGGGTGGLCTAIALSHAGIAIEIVALNPKWDVYGVGIIQQANALRALAALDLADKALRRYTERRYERCKAFVDLSRLMCRWEREHTPNADTEGLIRRSLEIAAQPI